MGQESRGGGVICDHRRPRQRRGFRPTAQRRERGGRTRQTGDSGIHGFPCREGQQRQRSPDSVGAPLAHASDGKPQPDNCATRLLAQIGGFGRQFLHVLGSTLAVLAKSSRDFSHDLLRDRSAGVSAGDCSTLAPSLGSRDKRNEPTAASRSPSGSGWSAQLSRDDRDRHRDHPSLLMALRVRAAVPLGILRRISRVRADHRADPQLSPSHRHEVCRLAGGRRWLSRLRTWGFNSSRTICSSPS